jgi:hypothetical protein
MVFLSNALLYADMLSVYVDYKPLKTEYVVVFEEIFVPADEIVEILKEKITYDPNTLYIKIGTKEIPQKGLMVKDRVFLPLKALVREIGYVMEMDRENNRLNVDTSRKLTPEPKMGMTTGGQPGGQAERRPRRGVSITLFQEDPISNMLEQVTALRVYADVKNDRARPSENIKAHCVFSYPRGEVFRDDVVTIEKLEPGESRRVVFYCTNPLTVGRLDYELKVVIEKPKPKDVTL